MLFLKRFYFVHTTTDTHLLIYIYKQISLSKGNLTICVHMVIKNKKEPTKSHYSNKPQTIREKEPAVGLYEPISQAIASKTDYQVVFKIGALNQTKVSLIIFKENCQVDYWLLSSVALVFSIKKNQGCFVLVPKLCEDFPHTCGFSFLVNCQHTIGSGS